MPFLIAIFFFINYDFKLFVKINRIQTQKKTHIIVRLHLKSSTLQNAVVLDIIFFFQLQSKTIKLFSIKIYILYKIHRK